MTWRSWKLKEEAPGVSEDTWRRLWDVSAPSGVDYTNAVFARSEPSGDVLLFFTPAARLLAEAFDAKPCDKPLRDGLRLVAGDQRAWAAHFGEPIGTPKMAGFEDTLPAELEATRPSPLR
jgi:hypothetical protein